VNLGDLLLDLRESRLDDNVSPYLWPDEELVRHLNEAVAQVAIRQRCLLESQNADLCTIDVSAGQQLVELDPAILAVRFLRQVGSTACVRPRGITAKRLFKMRSDWDTDTTTQGDIEFWVPDYQTDMLAIYPVPTAPITLQLNVWRLPLASEELVADDLGGVPVVNPAWHRYLGDWVEYRCYSKPDADAQNTGRAQEAAAAFTAKVGRLPSATEIRLWGVSPLVGVPAEFV
jgi:hypothetical protein